MEIINFLTSNYDNILALLGIGLIVYIILKNATNKQLTSLIISLMASAEMDLGSGTGALKKEYVLNKLPVIFKMLYKTEFIQIAIDEYAHQYRDLFDKINEKVGGTENE